MLVDDHYLVRQAFRILLEKINGIAVVAEADCGLKASKLIREHSVDLILMDVAMPTINGIAATERIVKEYPDIHIIMLTSYPNNEFIVESIDAGAKGYVLKSVEFDQLIDAINEVKRGNIYLDKEIKDKYESYCLNKSCTKLTPISQLTSRQKEVLQLIVEGYSTKKIADALNICIKTVDMHRYNLMETLGIYNVAGLVKFAIENKYL